jgi:hypothetical protein
VFLERRRHAENFSSHLLPQVSNPKGGAFVNAADEGDMLDEAAERQAFMDAVAEWRKADAGDNGARKPVTIEREYQSGGKAVGKSSDGAAGGSLAQSGGQSDMWKNPFAPSQEVFDDHVRPSTSLEIMFVRNSHLLVR